MPEALGAEPLAAAVAAGCDDAAAALGGHAGTEAVTALPHEFGGLIGALHLFEYRGVRPFFILSDMTGAILPERLAQQTLRRELVSSVAGLIERRRAEVNWTQRADAQPLVARIPAIVRQPD